MAQEFSGTATQFTPEAIGAAARRLGCGIAAVQAVIDVESQGGFQSDGRPRILFERHYFHRLTHGRFSASHADVSNPRWGGYGKPSAQYQRLHRAIALDRDAALRSASWGAFQIMGDNFAVAGFTNVEDFVAAMVESEDRQLDAFVQFAITMRLTNALRRCDWAGFARSYNGPAYRQNRYDEKLAKAFACRIAEAVGREVDGERKPSLCKGMRNEAVCVLQQQLGLPVDGEFGPLTHAAVLALQVQCGLTADGIVGARTWAVLEAECI